MSPGLSPGYSQGISPCRSASSSAQPHASPGNVGSQDPRENILGGEKPQCSQALAPRSAGRRRGVPPLPRLVNHYWGKPGQLEPQLKEMSSSCPTEVEIRITAMWAHGGAQGPAAPLTSPSLATAILLSTQALQHFRSWPPSAPPQRPQNNTKNRKTSLLTSVVVAGVCPTALGAASAEPCS